MCMAVIHSYVAYYHEGPYYVIFYDFLLLFCRISKHCPS